MNALLTPVPKESINMPNAIAAALTVVPGLGHVYKGHFAAGFIWMFLGMPIALWAGLLLSLATAGVGLLLPLLCWGALGYDAYCEKDRRTHQWLPPRDEED